MRTMTASMIKGNKSATKRMNRDGLPRPGTELRRVYDYFSANKGKVVDFKSAITGSANILTQLRNLYGCDIRSIKKQRWLFAGEYIDNKYVSYFEPIDGSD